MGRFKTSVNICNFYWELSSTVSASHQFHLLSLFLLTTFLMLKEQLCEKECDRSLIVGLSLKRMEKELGIIY